MTCEESSLLLSARMDGELSEEENKALEEHLASCEECRALSAQLEEVRSAFDGLEELPAPEGFSDRVMKELRRQEETPKVVPLFRRPAVRALMGAAACLMLCVGLFRAGTGSEHDGQAVAFAVEEPAEPAAVEPQPKTFAEGRTASCVLTLDRLPEGEAAEELTWEEKDGCLTAQVDRETLEAVMTLAEEQGITAELSGSPDSGDCALLVPAE